MIPDLPWTAIGAALAALVAVGTALGWWSRRSRRHRDHRTYVEPGYVAAPTPEQRALLQAANEVRDVLERHSREMSELRTFWSQRLDELSGRIGELARVQPRGTERAAEGRPGGDFVGYLATRGPGRYGAGSLEGQPAGGEPPWSPGPADQPVEVRDGVLVISRSLPPAGYLSATGSGQARVYLNAEVQLTEFSLPRWAAFFDLQGARPYAAYRTRRPAEVRWDEGTGRGELISKGTAEAI